MEKPKINKKLLNDLDAELSDNLAIAKTDEMADNPIDAQILIPAGKGENEAPSQGITFKPNGSFSIRAADNYSRENEVFTQGMEIPPFETVAHGGLIDEVINGGKETIFSDANVDLFGDPIPETRKYPATPVECFDAVIIGEDIIKIRTLTGNARKNADRALQEAAVLMLDQASKDCFWIPGNTASSKNSKDIGFYLKKSQKTGKMERVHVLVDSAITKKYKTATKGYWLQNKIEFLNQTSHLPIPIHIEFTFIRDSLRAFDFINACQVVADLMKENGYFADDDTVHFVPVFNPVVYYHPETPGVLFKVIKDK